MALRRIKSFNLTGKSKLSKAEKSERTENDDVVLRDVDIRNKQQKVSQKHRQTTNVFNFSDRLSEVKLRPKKTNKKLTRKLSMSLDSSLNNEYCDVLHELEKNKLFKQNKEKLEEKAASCLDVNATVSENTSNVGTVRGTATFGSDTNNNNSTPSASFSPQLQHKRLTSILKSDGAFSGTSKICELQKRKSVSSGEVRCEELIQNFSNGNEEKHNLPSKPPPFPTDDTEVEIRKTSVYKERYARSKTQDYSTNSKLTGSRLQLHGPIRIECNDCCKQGEFLYLDSNNHLWLQSNIRKSINKERILWTNSIKSIKVMKKDVVVRDEKRLYTFKFDSIKDAKIFEAELSQDIIEKTAKKSILSKLLGKRSSRDHLETKGIYKSEPIFGNTLEEIYKKGNEKIPSFITKTIELIQLPHNIKSMGVYRTSGNLATIQSIRFSLNQGNIKILNEYSNDVDVLTGVLKLFFRELKEPLIPYKIIPELTEVMHNKFGSEKEAEFRKIIDSLPLINKNILMYLTKHLLEVAKYKDENKMDISNLSICWSPSLIVIPDNIPDLVIQTANASKVVEFILTYYTEHPTELISNDCKEQDTKSEVGTIRRHFNRQESKDSLGSNDSGSKSLNRSNLSLNSEFQQSTCVAVSQLIKLVKLDEGLSMEGIYRKTGSISKRDKILKKIEKQKYDDLYEKGKRKYDVYDYCDALKKFIKDMKPPLIPKSVFSDFLKYDDCEDYEKLIRSIESLPSIGVLKELLCHLSETVGTKGMQMENVTKIWANVLNSNSVKNSSDEKLIEILLKRYGFKSKINQELKEKLDHSSRYRIVSNYDNVKSVDYSKTDNSKI